MVLSQILVKSKTSEKTTVFHKSHYLLVPCQGLRPSLVYKSQCLLPVLVSCLITIDQHVHSRYKVMTEPIVLTHTYQNDYDLTFKGQIFPLPLAHMK